MQIECIFCKIINKEIKANILYEDNNTIAILDLYPSAKGHTLIIPKKHYPSFLTTPNEELNFVNEVTKKIAQSLEKNIDAKGFNIITNVNAIAGQSIFHYHLHLIPKYVKEEDFILPPSTYKNNDNWDELVNLLSIKN